MSEGIQKPIPTIMLPIAIFVNDHLSNSKLPLLKTLIIIPINVNIVQPIAIPDSDNLMILFMAKPPYIPKYFLKPGKYFLEM